MVSSHFSPQQFLQRLRLSSGEEVSFYSLPQLDVELTQGEQGAKEDANLTGKKKRLPISQLPFSIRILLESALRNYDGHKITHQNIETLLQWHPHQQPEEKEEIPFVVARVILQDFTGVPLLVDLAAMRTALKQSGKDPKKLEPLVPVDLVIDHSLQVDFYGRADAMELNIQKEFQRNKERYQFLKWGQQAFEKLKIVPPGIGIVHQVNLEYLAKGVQEERNETGAILYPDTLVGTDSHTTMINGLGVVGWGVGGIEAEAAMLGQPLYLLCPDVVGVYLEGKLPTGSTATDLALTITELLRREKVVGKFVEFIGPGAASLSLPDRATIANMAPEYGATLGIFPVDEETIDYLRLTGRDKTLCEKVEAYYRAQGLFGIPTNPHQVQYSSLLHCHLDKVTPSVAGPKRPQDRMPLEKLAPNFQELLERPTAAGGYGREKANSLADEEKTAHLNPKQLLQDGSVAIAAITSCTNTSNPYVMIAAGLVAQKAVAKGLSVPDYVKTSLAPGSRVVTGYLQKSGLQESLNQLGFETVGYGCTTCIGNSGPLDRAIEAEAQEKGLILASVLSGNRNFEARIHPAIKANFLMSPPLVVAFALAGRVTIDFEKEPIGWDYNDNPIFLREIWPNSQEISTILKEMVTPELFSSLYASIASPSNTEALTNLGKSWEEIPSSSGVTYDWDSQSTYIQEPPFLKPQADEARFPLRNARALAILGDSVTTDHISPAGTILFKTPAGRYLQEAGVPVEEFNSYGSRRGNDRVMTRGTFANVRIKNLMLPGVEGGETIHYPSEERLSIFEASQRYQKEQVPLLIFAGTEYGTGSSRDWAAKGTRLLGVKAVIAKSFERIHRSNLVGMGVLPLQFYPGSDAATLQLDGSESFTLLHEATCWQPQQELELMIERKDGSRETLPLICRIDTPVEVEYYQAGGILPFMLNSSNYR